MERDGISVPPIGTQLRHKASGNLIDVKGIVNRGYLIQLRVHRPTKFNYTSISIRNVWDRYDKVE